MDLQTIEKYIKERSRIEVPDLQEHFSLSYSETNEALEKLEKKGAIRYCNGFTYDFVQLRLNEKKSDEEDNSNACNDDFDLAKARREYIEQRRREIIERRESITENGDDDESEEEQITDENRAYLYDEAKKMSEYNELDSTFSIKMSVSYPNGKPFRIKVVEEGNDFYVSDCGNTVDYLSEFNDRDALMVFFRKSLEGENVRFFGDAVCTTIDNIHDLTGECAYLIKVVNGLITQKNFDMYYLGKDLLNLASNIIKMDNAQLIVQALEILSEKTIRISSLKRELHIGYATAGRLLDKLIELDIIDGTSHIKKLNISQSFMGYLKRMLKNNFST